jgi:hypothetical protein
MLEAKSAITLALACCLFPALGGATFQAPPANIRLELRLRHGAAHNKNSIEFIFRLGPCKSTTLALAEGRLRNLALPFESICSAVQEIYCKQRHMA